MLNAEIAPGVVAVRPKNGDVIWSRGLLHDLAQPVSNLNFSVYILIEKMESAGGECDHRLDPEALLSESRDLVYLFKLASNGVRKRQETEPESSAGDSFDLALAVIFQQMKAIFENLPEVGVFEEGPEEFKEKYTESRELLGIFLESALAYSQNREYRPQFTPVRLHGFLADLLAINFPEETGNSRLTLACPRKQQAILETAVTDPRILTTVLVNLVSNGIKYSDPEDGPVKIRYRRVDGQLEISVRDYGIGLTAREIRAVTDDSRVYRTGLARKKAPGSGIGLSFCIRLLRMAGGEIKITSRGRHRGTRVRVRLPAEFI